VPDTEIERLEKQFAAQPTLRARLQLAHAYYRSDEIGHIAKALGHFFTVLKEETPVLIGVDGQPLSSTLVQEEREIIRRAIGIARARLHKAIRKRTGAPKDAVGRPLARVPGLMPERDPDSRPYPRGTTQEKWDALGTWKDHEEGKRLEPIPPEVSGTLPQVIDPEIKVSFAGQEPPKEEPPQ
jgi:hypothetical protein